MGAIMTIGVFDKIFNIVVHLGVTFVAKCDTVAYLKNFTFKQ